MNVPLDPGKDERIRSHWPLRSEPDEVMAARQLGDACIEARTDEDRQYALGEAVSFLDQLGGGADSMALIALLSLPADADCERLLAEAERRLAERAPAVVGALLRVVVEGDQPASDNAAEALDEALEADLAQGLVEVLQDDDAQAGMKRAAAAGLVSLGSSAADQLAEAFDDPEISDWITEAAGCPPDATWDELMEAIADGGDADPTAGAVGGEVADDVVAPSEAGDAADASEDVDVRDEARDEGDDDLRLDDGPFDLDLGTGAADAEADDEALDDVVDSAVDDAEEEEGGFEPVDAGAPGADLERDFAAFEDDFRAFDADLKRGPRPG
jgi:hypothetical protein